LTKGNKKKPVKSNDELAAEFEAKLRVHEEAQSAKGRIFDPQLLIERASKIIEIKHPVLGLLRYGELTFEDSFEINKCSTDVEKTEMVLQQLRHALLRPNSTPKSKSRPPNSRRQNYKSHRPYTI
jgi:hypothetical protein